jgi:protein gp37
MGVSIENCRWAERADALRQVPAAVRFISAEPLLASVADLDLAGIHWLIAGGESQPRTGSAQPLAERVQHFPPHRKCACPCEHRTGSDEEYATVGEVSRS